MQEVESQARLAHSFQHGTSRQLQRAQPIAMPKNQSDSPNQADLKADRVFKLVARKAGREPTELTLSTRLLHDLALYGDDAEELIVELRTEFDVDFSELEFEEYFFPEGAAVWLLPEVLRRRVNAPKREITIGSLIAAVNSRKWQT